MTNKNSAYNREYYLLNKDKFKNARQAWYKKNKTSVINKSKEYASRLRLTVLKHYSGGTPHCNCCGEKQLQFLSIDHIDNDGKELRKVHSIGATFYNWIISNNFPENLQILCQNCNHGKRVNGGVCPHLTD